MMMMMMMMGWYQTLSSTLETVEQRLKLPKDFRFSCLCVHCLCCTENVRGYARIWNMACKGVLECCCLGIACGDCCTIGFMFAVEAWVGVNVTLFESKAVCVVKNNSKAR